MNYVQSTAELIRKAKATTTPPDSKRHNTERWMPVVDVFRQRNWSYRQIYRWLKAEGEPVQENEISFVTAVSRRYKRMLAKEGAKP